MVPILGNVAALSVALIFYTWRAFTQVQARKQRTLCERVTYMLWVMAERVDQPAESLAADVG